MEVNTPIGLIATVLSMLVGSDVMRASRQGHVILLLHSPHVRRLPHLPPTKLQQTAR